MDAAALKARLDAARTFEHPIGDIVFRVRMLSEQRKASIYARHDGPTRMVEAMADLLAESVQGVRGATTLDLGLDGPAEPIDDDQASAVLLLQERQDLANELASELIRRSQERSDAIEADRKN